MRNQPRDLPLRPLPPVLMDNAPPVDATVKARDGVYQEYHDYSQGQRISTDELIAEAIRKQYPALHLTITETNRCRLLAFASAGHASATQIDENNGHSENLRYRFYVPPARRLDSQQGFLADSIQFGKYLYKWELSGQTHEYIVYFAVGGKGPYDYNLTYILSATQLATDKLMLAACKYAEDIHDRVLLFDSGYWQLSSELFESIRHASWDDVILDPEMKRSIVGEVDKFFNSREKYGKLKVPWKRGIIYYGPPGNGKTISIKATMHSLYFRSSPIPTLYVRSLSSYQGPEYALNQIFSKARQQAPCLLVFEDLDSLVTDNVRSYFLNEVDGLKNNDGILMVGSTNHLERLDPGISKRPSRFDRKYLFPDPNLEERVAYCAYWRGKLEANKELEFPEKMEWAIAGITKGFSFAYIQEAFVAALLTIANGEAGDEKQDTGTVCRCGGKCCPECNTAGQWRIWAQSGCRVFELGDDDDLEGYLLWREIKKVVKALREELDESRS